jgi:microcin C transport system substrate-binding protein
VKRDVLPDQTPSGAQGWFINTRREKFKNPLLREALIYAFDFEWTNKSIMYGSYERTHSVFHNSNLMAVGKPRAEELARWSRSGAKCRRGVRRAVRAAGLRRSRRPRAAAQIERAPARGRLPIEQQMDDAERRADDHRVLFDEPEFQPHHAVFTGNLSRVGTAASSTRCSIASGRRLTSIWSCSVSLRETPGDCCEPSSPSQAAGMKGSQNLAGMADLRSMR